MDDPEDHPEPVPLAVDPLLADPPLPVNAKNIDRRAPAPPDPQPVTASMTVNLVVAFLGAFALIGLTGTIWLVSVQAEGANIALVSTLTGGAVGSIGTLLASTRSTTVPPPPEQP